MSGIDQPLANFSSVTKLHTPTNQPARVQITRLVDITGLYQSDVPFVVKNITEENVTVTGRLACMDSDITTVLAPGWNPELFVELDNVPASTLQAGF